MTEFLKGRGFERWFAELGVTDAPVTRKGLSTTLQFFHDHMPSLPRKSQLDYLRGIDLHRPVEIVMLDPGVVVTAYRKHNEDPFKTFYTRPGNSLHRLGVNPEPGGTARGHVRYRVKESAVALESKCAPAWDKWSDDRPEHLRHYYEASGGGAQLIIPGSRKVLEVVEWSGPKRPGDTTGADRPRWSSAQGWQGR
jgi:hypothetical protein